MHEIKKTVPTTASFRGFFLLICLTASLPAVAQLQNDNGGNGADDPMLEEVTVTATGTAIRGVAPVGSQTLSISSEDLFEATTVDLAAYIREIPQASGLGRQEVENDFGGNVGFAQGINLRGLGNNATLVLFDGHRLVGQGVTEQFADPNQLPVSAIERVEVVMDAASAVYGSDAVAGVVNFILRDDFDGLEVNARYSTSLLNSTTIDVLGGRSWNGGNAWIGVMYEDRGSFARNERDFLLENLTQFGGNDFRFGSRGDFRAGPQPYILANDTIYGVPTTNGAVPNAADVLALENNFTISDRGDEIDFSPERERLAVSARARQSLFEDRGELVFTGVYSQRESLFVNEFVDDHLVTVTPDSPYWVDGVTTDDSYQMGYSLFYNNQGPGALDVTNRPDEKALNTYLDFNYEINDDWLLAANLSYGNNEGCGRCGRRENTGVLDAGWDDAATDPNGYSNIFNPFLQGPQAQFFDLAYGTSNQETGFDMLRYALKFEGGMFDMAGGRARIAFGADYEDTTQSLRLFGTGGRNNNPPLESFVTRDTESDRQITSAYVETFFPFSDALAVNVALRHDDYSDFGSTTNPRLGINFSPTDRLTLRATAAQAFRAPTLVETNPGVLEQNREGNFANDGGDPNIPQTSARRGTTAVLFRIGNTPGLQPETADVWTLGFDYEPIDRLMLSATYYDVNYENRIEELPNLTAALSNAENRDLYSPYIVAAPQPDTCVTGDFSTYNALYGPLVNSPNLRPTARTDDCDWAAIVQGGTQNTGRLLQSGLDLQARYNWDTSVGNWGVSLNVSKVLDLTRSLLPGGEDVDQLDRIGFQNSTRATARLSWSRGNWMTSVDATHVGDYINDLPITVNGVTLPESRVPSWNTLGLNVTYVVGSGANSGWLDGTRIGLAIDNLTDRDPPVVLKNESAVDLSQHNVFGRTMSLTLQKQF